ncbi:MAG: hypothetical protein V1872_14990 [bacterium]
MAEINKKKDEYQQAISGLFAVDMDVCCKEGRISARRTKKR